MTSVFTSQRASNAERLSICHGDTKESSFTGLSSTASLASKALKVNLALAHSVDELDDYQVPQAHQVVLWLVRAPMVELGLPRQAGLPGCVIQLRIEGFVDWRGQQDFAHLVIIEGSPASWSCQKGDQVWGL